MNGAIAITKTPPVIAANLSITRMALNAVTNVLQSASGLILSFWLTRHLIHTLGISQYGLYPLTKNIVEYFSLATALVLVPASRNMMMEHVHANPLRAGKVFNSFFFGIVALLVCLTPLLITMVWFSPMVVKAPAGLTADIRILFAAVSISFVLTTLTAPFGVATFVKNSLYLKNIGDLVELVAFAMVAMLMTGFAGMGLPGLALAVVVRSVVRLGWAVGCKVKLLPEIPIRRSLFSRRYLQDILSLSGWLFVSAAGTLLFVNTDLLIINRMIGPEATGKYGSILILYNALIAVASVVTNVMTPPLLAVYARKGRDRFLKNALMFARTAGILIAAPIGLVCGLAAPLLTVWLGPSFAPLTPVLMIMSLPLILEITMAPVSTLRILEKKIAVPTLVFCGFGIVKIGIGVALIRSMGFGIMGMAIASAIFQLLNAAITTPLYCAHIAARSPWGFYRAFVPGVAGVGFVIASSLLVHHLLPAPSPARLIITAVLVVSVYGIFSWIFLIDKRQKRFIRSRASHWARMRRRN
jgi:O-antigen/teichoic acid export membrane protein